ncbi:MAG: TonB-dependent receptor [Winogradskyella sp.]|uniref:TonB-dependent receptor plug domain-containing protein n=1 Tax=Winogradskyella sp. TaxID=1883156 RepID=UPI000F405934|nr:TonB-dependent receptor [Winogradskyella sp.]RNC80190.1 MAG: TonB-dependent receptor [Winogradskyella sp.]
MILNKNYLTIYFSLLISILSTAQVEKPKDSTEAEKLDQVLITATRTVRQLSSVPLPAQIITKKELQNINSIRLSDILEEQTGLIIAAELDGTEGIQMQGLSSQYILILIDGVPLVGRSFGALNLNRISVGNIKQIEVIKGASSSLYGNEALGGVINIITETPKSGFNGDVNYRGGSFNTHDTGINLNFKKEKFGITTFFNRNSSGGYDLDESTPQNTIDPFTSYTFNSNINYKVSDKTELLLSGRYYYQFQDNVALNDEFIGENSLNEWNINLRTEHEFNTKWKSYLELYGSQYITDDISTSDITGETLRNDFDQRFLRPELRTTYKPNDNSEFIFGVGITNERLERSLFSTTPEFNAPYVYTQYDGNISDKLNIILGARFDAHNVYESQFSPKAAIQYKISDKISVKGSVGYGYKAPDFRQLYLDFTNAAAGGYTVLGYNEVPRRLQELFEQNLLNFSTMPNGQEFSNAEKQQEINLITSNFNSDLKAESSINFNLGFDFKINNNLKFNVNGFRNNITNLIQVLVVRSAGLGTVTDRPQLIGRDNGQNVFSYENRDEVYTQGIEVNAEWKINNNFRLSGGYQLLYAYDKEDLERLDNGLVFVRDPNTQVDFRIGRSDYIGLQNTSRHNANLKLFYTAPEIDLDANIRATYRSQFGLGDTNGNGLIDRFDLVLIDPQTIVDLAINKAFFKNYRLGIGVDNIFDLTDNQTPNIPGRILYGTLNINF